MGRTIGPVGDRSTQRAVVEAALTLLETAEGPEAIREFASPDVEAAGDGT